MGIAQRSAVLTVASPYESLVFYWIQKKSLRPAQIQEVGRLTLLPNGESGKITSNKRWWDESALTAIFGKL